MPRNSLTHILNVNNTDTSVDQKIIQYSNIQSINAKFDQLRIILEGLERQNCEFSAICLQETWLSEASDISLLALANKIFFLKVKYALLMENFIQSF